MNWPMTFDLIKSLAGVAAAVGLAYRFILIPNLKSNFVDQETFKALLAKLDDLVTKTQHDDIVVQMETVTKQQDKAGVDMVALANLYSELAGRFDLHSMDIKAIKDDIQETKIDIKETNHDVKELTKASIESASVQQLILQRIEDLKNG